MSKEFNDIVEPGSDYPEITVNEEEGTAELSEQEPRPEEEPEKEEPVKADEPESTEAEDEPEQEPAVDPREELFNELGLNKQFPGGLDAAIKSIPEMNRYLTQLQQERAELKRKLEDRESKQEPGEPAVDPYDDPQRWSQSLQKRVDEFMTKTRSEFDQRFDQMQAQMFIQTKSDFHDYRDAMQHHLNMNPGLGQLPVSESLPILYNLAKAQEVPRLVKEQKAQTVSTPDKERAKTSVGKKQSRPATKSAQDYVNMTEEELEREIGVNEHRTG